MKTWADSERIGRRAYFHFLERNRAAGHVVHGHDREDYERATKDLTFTCKDEVAVAELRVALVGMRYFSWFDTWKWNQTALKVLANDYFPLLRMDDMVEYGDRVSPAHMLSLLIQRDRITYPDRAFTEEEFDLLDEHRKTIASIREYVIRDTGDRYGDLASRLIHETDAIPVHDSEYIWGKKYEKEKTTFPEPSYSLIGKKLLRPIMIGDTVEVVRNKCGAIRKISPIEYLQKGDRIVVRKIGQSIIWYHVGSTEYYINIKDVIGCGFEIDYPKTTLKTAANPDSYFKKTPSKTWTMNVYADCVRLEPSYAERQCRINPRHVADVIALRFLDLITAQQSRALLERVWDNFGWYDVFHHVRELGLLQEFDGDLTETIHKVLAESAAAVEDYRKGKRAAFGRIMGNAMKACAGKARPNHVREILERLLG